ncbi:MAG: family 20 glycosylhydrolase [Candidatus Didemnitutus sp.]|nr:family 20 glycosylhydrolase [Candidatus Didemnitutus sp.]
MLPVPAEVRRAVGVFAVEGDLSFALGRGKDPRVAAAMRRMLERWERRIGRAFVRSERGERLQVGRREAHLVIDCRKPGPAVPMLGEDESYRLTVSPQRVELSAATGTGLLRGLATLEQWLQHDGARWVLPAVQIVDRPRFPWRGLLIDVCRHWQSLSAIKRQLDAMALVKLNVLHLHLTEDQGFRVESRRFPRLHELGSDGKFYTQEELRELVGYAAARGIRVVPEFDVPGHVTSWLIGHPELAAGRAPKSLRRHWGVSEEAMDPTNEGVYELLDGLVGEMAAIFPDRHFHIGGDEVKAKRWSADARIQRFIRDHALGDNRGLQAYFNRRVREILRRHGREMVGWDEILHPDLPASTVVQSWRGVEGLAAATRMGRRALLSNGYYLDLSWSAEQHYGVDPIPAGTPLTDAEQRLVLGGEAAMWSEWVTEERLDMCVWPRAAVVAERLWSSAAVHDADDLYRRLGSVERRLEEGGLRHEANRAAMLRRLAPDDADERLHRAIGCVADVCEPPKNYGRNQHQPEATQALPLSDFVDCLRVESVGSRRFQRQVEQFLATGSPVVAADMRTQIDEWAEASASALAGVTRKDVRSAAARLAVACEVFIDALDHLERGRTRKAGKRTAPGLVAPVDFALHASERLLDVAASLKREGGARAAWHRQVVATAALPMTIGGPVYEDHL